MFRRSSSASAHFLSNGSCNLPEAQLESEVMHAPALPSLVYYAAVANGAVVLSEYVAEDNGDLPAMAAACLENVPPLHVSFSYTAHHRRFMCLLDGVVTYCAITDEALCKADVLSFLRRVRDAFKGFGKGRGNSLTLGAHFLDEEMIPVMRNLASLYIGVPQKERNRTETEPLVRCDTEADMEVSSPSAVAPVYDMTDHEFASKTEEKKVGSHPRKALVGKVRKWRKKTKQPAKEGLEGKGQEARNNDSSLEVVIDAGLSGVSEKNKYNEMQKLWRRKELLSILC